MGRLKDVESTKQTKSYLNQLVDIIQEDISGSNTRRKYQVFVTGGIGPGVTSSLYQTVYDQNFTLQTANPIMDLTVGLYLSGATVQTCSNGEDSSGKLLFPSTSLMMREKVDVYSQYSKLLLGNSKQAFYAPFNDSNDDNRIENAFFISFKRLFARDKIKKETFAMRFYTTGVVVYPEGKDGAADYAGNSGNTAEVSADWPYFTNLNRTSTTGSTIFTDIGAATNTVHTFGGEVANIVQADNTANKVGLIFYDHGTCVFDLEKITSGTQFVSGVIDAMNNNTALGLSSGKTILGGLYGAGAQDATVVPDLMTSASIDDILDCICTTRFSSGTLTAMTFQNITTINSMLIFCRATADDFNYSSNPTFTNDVGRIRVIDQGQEQFQRSFTFPTTVGLYDDVGNLLAVAKMSRPIEKNDEKDVTFRVRLDF